MSELRQDSTTGEWVLIAPGRGGRPGAWSAPSEPRAALPSFDPACPFCPGNESALPGILAEIPGDGAPGWRTRIVPNKYPALSPQPARLGEGGTARSAGHGHHEVIVEHPRHDATLASLDDPSLLAVIATYQQRCRELLERPGIESVVLFRNQGESAGASLSHPHAQIMALDVVPPRLARIARWTCDRHDETGLCATCAAIAAERADASRVIEESPHFLVAVPFAAAGPSALWIVPKRHQPSFSDMEEAERTDLAWLLRRSLRRLAAALGDPPYKLVVESATRGELGAAYRHWCLRIAPELLRPGGFELASDLPINPSCPEDDAAALRAAAC